MSSFDNNDVFKKFPMYLSFEIPLIISIFYYALTAVVARSLRLAVNERFYKFKYLHTVLMDFITSFQLMAFSLENGQVRKHYGELAYTCTLVCVGLWAVYAISDGQANPCTTLIDVLIGKYNIRWGFLRGIIQLCGAITSYQFAKIFWSLGFTKSHWIRYMENNCASDLKVLAIWGFLIEFFGTLVYVAASLTKFSKMDRLENFGKSLLGAVLTIIG